MKRTTIVIHHTAGKDNKYIKDYNQILNDHLDRGWRDIGYNYVIEYVTGKVKIHRGRKLDIPGAHCPQHNMNKEGIGIAIVGNFERHAPDIFLIQELACLCSQLCLDHDIPPGKIRSHKEFKPTLCPGKHMPMDYIRQLVKDNLTTV